MAGNAETVARLATLLTARAGPPAIEVLAVAGGDVVVPPPGCVPLMVAVFETPLLKPAALFTSVWLNV